MRILTGLLLAVSSSLALSIALAQPVETAAGGPSLGTRPGHFGNAEIGFAVPDDPLLTREISIRLAEQASMRNWYYFHEPLFALEAHPDGTLWSKHDSGETVIYQFLIRSSSSSLRPRFRAR